MYIPTWLIIIIIIIGIYLYFRSKKNSSGSNSQPRNIKSMWEQAEVNMARVLGKSPLLEDYLQDERDMVKSMERDMIRLRERYKHNDQKQIEIARDWMNYSACVAKIKFAREMLDVDMKNDAYDRFDERVKESYITLHEIGERVAKELGQDSGSKLVHNRLRKQAEIGNKIFEEKKESNKTIK